MDGRMDGWMDRQMEWALEVRKWVFFSFITPARTIVLWHTHLINIVEWTIHLCLHILLHQHKQEFAKKVTFWALKNGGTEKYSVSVIIIVYEHILFPILQCKKSPIHVFIQQLLLTPAWFYSRYWWYNPEQKWWTLCSHGNNLLFGDDR